MNWSNELWREILPWLEQAYPNEGCGLILETRDGDFVVKCSENLADKYHALDPQTFPRTAKNFYMINPMEFVRAEERGERVAVIFHSHPDVGDYFSEEDIAAATLPRESEDEALEPSYPGTDYLVVSVRNGRADRASLYSFDEQSKAFQSVREFQW